MVNRSTAVYEIDLSDEEDDSEWNYRNGHGAAYENHHSKGSWVNNSSHASDSLDRVK